MVLAAAGPAPAGVRPPSTFNPLVEAANYSITLQRQAIYDTPAYQAKLTADSASSLADALRTQVSDPGRFFTDDRPATGAEHHAPRSPR